MTIQVRHKFSGILATTSQDPRVLGNAWEIVSDESASEPAEAVTDDKPAENTEAKESDDDSSGASDKDEDGADDGDSAADGRGDEPAKGTNAGRKSVRRGTTRKSAKSDSDKTA